MEVKAFNGINNVTDPIRLGLGWLATADNVNITDTGAIEKREGYTEVSTGAYSGIYSTIDDQRCYLVKEGSLKTFGGVTLKTGLSSAAMHWTELNAQVFFSNGVDSGIINPDNSVIDWRWDVPATPAVTVLNHGAMSPGLYRIICTKTFPDGRETGPSEYREFEIRIEYEPGARKTELASASIQVVTTDNVYVCSANSTVFQYAGRGTMILSGRLENSLGRELPTDGFDPLPTGIGTIQAWRGRVYAAMYMPKENQTAVWFSEPFGPHLFDLAKNFFMVPGHAHMLAPTKDALIVGTDERIYAYNTESIAEIAPYGVVPGQHWAQDGDRIIFWSTRGVCAALPFTNLTEKTVSVAPGIKAGGTIVRRGGQERYLVALQQGGSAYNVF